VSKLSRQEKSTVGHVRRSQEELKVGARLGNGNSVFLDNLFRENGTLLQCFRIK
jgi:hypothetical protein